VTSRGLTAASFSASPGAGWTGACYDRPEGAFKKHRLTCTLLVGLPRFELPTFGPPDRCTPNRWPAQTSRNRLWPAVL